MFPGLKNIGAHYLMPQKDVEDFRAALRVFKDLREDCIEIYNAFNKIIDKSILANMNMGMDFIDSGRSSSKV